MLRIPATPEEMNAAAKVARRVDLVQLVLRKVEVVADSPKMRQMQDAPLAVRFRLRKPHYDLHETSLVVPVGLIAEVHWAQEGQGTSGAQPDTRVALIEVVYEATYEVAEPAQFQPAEFLSFARLNALHNCWPFLRTTINQLTGEMGIPILIPLVRLHSQEKKAEDAKGAAPDESGASSG